MDWPVYLINLDKDRMRLEAATAELARVGSRWTRIAAVNGRQLPAERIAKVYDKRRNRAYARHPLTPPEIGCYLSHIAAWRAIAGADAPGGVVLEDDFRVTGDFAAALRVVSADQGDWDMVKLFTFRPDARRLRPRDVGSGMEIAEPYKVPSTMLGYALRREAADRLLSRAQPFFRPVDEDMKFYWERDLKVALLSPQPIAVGNQDTAEGSVGDSRRSYNKKDTRSGLERMVAGIRYQASYAVGLHRRRLFG